MEFYKLWFNDDGDSWQIAIDEKSLELAGGDYWAYSRGECCRSLAPVSCRIAKPGEAVDFDRDPVTTAPIVSRRLGDLLKRIAPNDIQLIPAMLDAPGAWVIVNVLSLVDAIDYNNSVMSFHDAAHPAKPGKPSGIMRLIVLADSVLPHHICRLKDFTVAIIVSGLVKDECQKAGMTNMKFIPATMAEWSRYIENPKDDKWCFRTGSKRTAL